MEHEGAVEYVLDFGTFTDVCARHHLFPISPNYDWFSDVRARDGKHPLFEPAGAPASSHDMLPCSSAFRHFNPQFKGPDQADLEQARSAKPPASLKWLSAEVVLVH